MAKSFLPSLLGPLAPTTSPKPGRSHSEDQSSRSGPSSSSSSSSFSFSSTSQPQTNNKPSENDPPPLPPPQAPPFLALPPESATGSFPRSRSGSIATSPSTHDLHLGAILQLPPAAAAGRLTYHDNGSSASGLSRVSSWASSSLGGTPAHTLYGAGRFLASDAESGVAFFNDGEDESIYSTATTSPHKPSNLAQYQLAPKKTRIDFTRQLPVELSQQILTHLSPKDLCACALVSQSWRSLADSDAVWREKYSSLSQWPQVLPADLSWKQLYATKSSLNFRWARGQPVAKALVGHQDSVYSCHYNEEIIVTGSRDHTIKVWHADTGALLKTIGRPTEGAGASQPAMEDSGNSSDDSSGDDDEFVHMGSVVSIHFADGLMVSGSSDSTFIVRDLETMRGIVRVRHHTGGVLGVCVSDKYVATCSKDSTICVWDRSECRLGNPVLPLVAQLRGHRGPVNAIQLRGDHLVSAGGDGVVKLWTLNGSDLPGAPAAPLVPPGSCLRSFRGHTRGLACVQIAEGDKFETVISGGNDNTIRVWDVLSGSCVRVLAGHKDMVRCVDVSCGRIVSASYDLTIRVWDYESGKPVAELSGWFGSWIFTAKATAKRIVATSFGIKPVILDFGEGLDQRYLDYIK